MIRTWMRPGKTFLLMMTLLSLLYFIYNERTSVIEEKEDTDREWKDTVETVVQSEKISPHSNLTTKDEEKVKSIPTPKTNTEYSIEEKIQNYKDGLVASQYLTNSYDRLLTTATTSYYEGSVTSHKNNTLTYSMFTNARKAISLDLLKEVSMKTYSEIMEAALKNLPLGSQPHSHSMQVIIAATWRSGSTFLEELIQSHSGFYNSYEPLLIYGIKNFYNASEPEAQDALKIVMDILKCKYDDWYIKQARETSKELFSRNTRVWQACRDPFNNNELCFQKDFLEIVCPLFPWSLMKLVRLGIGLLRPILEDKSLNTHVIFLVRDPRAVINSRKDTVKWCTTASCLDPSTLCRHMEDDLKSYRELSSLFPGKLHLIRYEDLSLSPLNTTKNLLQDMKLDFDPLMQRFIETHTTTNHDVPWSTSRESAKRVLYWTTKIDKKSLNNIQNVCSSTMEKFGYIPIDSTENMLVENILAPLPV